MTLLAICWTVWWVIAGIYMAGKKGRPKARAAIEALLFGPFVLLLLSLAKQAKKGDLVQRDPSDATHQS